MLSKEEIDEHFNGKTPWIAVITLAFLGLGALAMAVLAVGVIVSNLS